MRLMRWVWLLMVLAVAVRFAAYADEDRPVKESNDKKSVIKAIPGFKYLKEQTFSCGGQTNTIKIYLHEKTGLEFVLIPGGTFTMGSPGGESGRWYYEGPLHIVTIKPFLICRTECTQVAWDRIGGNDKREWKGADLPIEGANWIDCTSWCRKTELRLPTEAEWEYACRSGNSTRFYFGDSDKKLNGYAWYVRNSSRQTHPVAGKQPNAFGLFDMHGNVWEWSQDKWHKNYTGAPTDWSSWESGGSWFKVSRGGSSFCPAGICRSAIRCKQLPGLQSRCIGFRPAFTLPDIENNKDDNKIQSQHQTELSFPNGFTFLKEETFSCGGQTNTMKIYRQEMTELNFVLIPGNDKVKSFLICQTEVTQTSWNKIMGTTPWKGIFSCQENVKEGDDYPATYLCFDECNTFCENTGLDLPSDEEWEYACRGGTTTAYSFGDSESELGDYAWFSGNTAKAGEKYPHRVGKKKPNAFGLHDMHGNVWELCQDLDKPGSSRLIQRGGSWLNVSQSCRSAQRHWNNSYFRGDATGFRPTCSLPDNENDEPIKKQPKKQKTDKKVPDGFKYLKEQTFSCGGQTNTVGIYLHKKTGLNFVLAPEGSYKLKKRNIKNDEVVVKEVQIKSFLICQTEVTQAAWKKVMGTLPWISPPDISDKDEYPIKLLENNRMHLVSMICTGILENGAWLLLESLMMI